MDFFLLLLQILANRARLAVGAIFVQQIRKVKAFLSGLAEKAGSVETSLEIEITLGNDGKRFVKDIFNP